MKDVRVGNTMSWEALDRIVLLAFGEGPINELWLWLQACCLHPHRVAALPTPEGVEEAAVTEDDIAKLLQFDYIRERFDVPA